MTKDEQMNAYKSSSSQITATHRGKKKKNWTWRKTFWLMFFTISLLIFCIVGGYLFVFLHGERLVREYKKADLFQPAEVSTVYDVTQKEITKLGKGVEHREIIDSKEISNLIKQAFIATEDRRFEEHEGIDLWSIGRAMVKDIMARRIVEGGSTITQQLAKNMFLTADKTLFRKATEVSIALALENHFTKEEILAMYLNCIYFGKGAYGIKTAAKIYFNQEDLHKLKLWQVATLAAIPKAPSRYNPLSDPEKSKERRRIVLQLMYEQNYITQEEAKQAGEVDYNLQHSGKVKLAYTYSGAYDTFIDYLIQEAEEKIDLSEDALYRGGYHIYTTLDGPAQRIMHTAFNNDQLFERSKDNIKVQGAMVITQHDTGAVVAMMGGRDYMRKGLSRVAVKRQPGSSFKPIMAYAPAIESGQYLPWSKLNNEKQCFGKYCPTNLGGYSAEVEMTTALKKSINIPAVWLLHNIGIKTGFAFAKNLGFPLTEEDYNLSIALGGLTRGVTPLHMASAYNAFANGGVYYPAYTITKITDRKGNLIYNYRVPRGKQVMNKQTAYYMTEMMQEVVKSGTGRQAQITGRIVAGKTGTTQHGFRNYKGTGDRDAWFVGYTPEWTAAVWMGYDKTDRQHLLHNSSRDAAKMFREVMGKALQAKKSHSFTGFHDVKLMPPKAMSHLSATYSEQNQSVSLRWNPIAGENATYDVYRKSGHSQKATRIITSRKETSAEDTSVFPGNRYTYYVTTNIAGVTRSNEVSVVIKKEQPFAPLPSSEIKTPRLNKPLPKESVPPIDTDSSVDIPEQNQEGNDEGSNSITNLEHTDETSGLEQMIPNE